MASPWVYAIASVVIVSLISLIGVFTLSVKSKKLHKALIYLVSFSAGALLGDAFLHLLPELVEESGLTTSISLYILGGIALFFVVEKFIHWHHCHLPTTETHTHSFAKMNLIGDGVHNFLDGLIIGVAYLVNIPAGIATTIAVALHEIPQEIGDFSILLHGGYTKTKALMLNFASALVAVIGTVVALSLGGGIENIEQILIPIAIGGFIYIAGSDLIPELHKDFQVKKSIIQLVAFAVGILIMFLLLGLE